MAPTWSSSVCASFFAHLTFAPRLTQILLFDDLMCKYFHLCCIVWPLHCASHTLLLWQLDCYIPHCCTVWPLLTPTRWRQCVCAHPLQLYLSFSESRPVPNASRIPLPFELDSYIYQQSIFLWHWAMSWQPYPLPPLVEVLRSPHNRRLHYNPPPPLELE